MESNIEKIVRGVEEARSIIVRRAICQALPHLAILPDKDCQRILSDNCAMVEYDELLGDDVIYVYMGGKILGVVETDPENAPEEISVQWIPCDKPELFHN